MTAQRILDAGKAVFDEQWLDHTTLEQVAERAGATVQTVLRRFGSKEQLVAAVGQQIYVQGKQQRNEAPVGDIAGVIGNLLAHYDMFGKRLLRVQAQEERDPTLHGLMEEGRQAHRQWVERVFAPSSHRSRRHDALASWHSPRPSPMSMSGSCLPSKRDLNVTKPQWH